MGIVSLSVFFYYRPIEVGIQVSVYDSFLTVVTAPLLCIQVSISTNLKYSARFGRRESDGQTAHFLLPKRQVKQVYGMLKFHFCQLLEYPGFKNLGTTWAGTFFFFLCRD